MKRITIIFVSMVFLFIAPFAWASTYYASPTGGGNGSSTSKPFRISNFWGVASPGDTLYLLNGTYTGSSSMITPPKGKSGKSGSPIKIIALNKGKALIDGQRARNPVVLNNNDWFILDGFNMCRAGSGNNGRVLSLTYSDHNIVRNVIGWDADPKKNSYIFHSSNSKYNLFEDCAGWGSARKIFSNYMDDHLTLRRCFARWTYYNTSAYNWTGAFTYSYKSTNTILENCIGTWDEYPEVTVGVNLPAIFIDDATYANGGYKTLGCIAYHLKTQKGEPLALWRYSNRNSTTNYTIKDCVAYTDKIIDGGMFKNMTFNGSYLTFIGGGAAGESKYAMVVNKTNGKVKHVIQQNSTYKGVSDGSKFDYIMFYHNTAQDYYRASPSNYTTSVNPDLIKKCGNILQYGLSEKYRPKVNGHSVGAQIQYQYINGVLTDKPLWPWPMNYRIKEAMSQSGYANKGGLDGKGGLDLTKVIFGLGGGTVPFSNTLAAPTNLWAQ